MALRKIRNRWYTYFRDEHGKQHTISCMTDDRAKAEKFEKHMQGQIWDRRCKQKLEKFMTGGNGVPNGNASAIVEVKKSHHRGTIRLDEMLDEVLKNRKISGTYMFFWRHFVKNCGKTYADEITPKLAMNYLERFYAGKSAKTYNNHKAALNTIFRLCQVQAGISESPFKRIANRAITDVESHRNLSDEEIDRIMRTGGDDIRIMTMLGRWTGQRLKECALMAFNDFDFERKVFLVEPGKTSRFKKFVCVPIFRKLEIFLLSIKSKIKNYDEPIICSFGYKGDKQFSVDYKKFLHGIDIFDSMSGTASFHSLRGSFITWAKDVGLSRDIRESITGHSSLTTEEIYARSIKLVSDAAKSGVGS